MVIFYNTHITASFSLIRAFTLKFNLLKSLFIFLCGLSYTGITSCVNTQQIKIENDTHKAKLIYQHKSFMSINVAFVPESSQAIINNSENALIIDYEKNNEIGTLPSPDTDYSINSVSVSPDNNSLLLATKTAVQLWDINTLKPLSSFTSKKYSQINAFSPNGKYLIFNEKVINLSSNQVVMEFSHDVVPTEYDFSDNDQFLAIGGHISGTAIIDIENKLQMNTIFNKGMQSTRFGINSDLYSGYNSKLLPDLGGYYAASIGLYDIKNQQRQHEYTPSNRISCWVRLSNNKILATLVNGKIQLLSQQLDLEKSWQLGDKITLCAAGNNNTAWMGSEKAGIYLFDLNSGVINRVIESINDPAQLVISKDGTHLGIVKQMRDGAGVNIYSIAMP